MKIIGENTGTRDLVVASEHFNFYTNFYMEIHAIHHSLAMNCSQMCQLVGCIPKENNLKHLRTVHTKAMMDYVDFHVKICVKIRILICYI